MAPKKGKKKGGQKMSLAVFNPAASVGVPQELRALPSAPKQADEWEAVGGRPEYNSRGFKERTVTHDYDDNALLESDEAFLQRDWVRGSSMLPDSEGGAGQGMGDRDFGGARGGGAFDAEGGGERDFGGARMGGGVDASFESGGGGVERDFGGARMGGGVDASFESGGGGVERDFGGARSGGGVDASFDAGGGGGERDFGAARGGGGVEASFESGGAERDFGAARGGGGVEASFESGGAERDFGSARENASFDAEFSGGKGEVDFSKRSGPIEAEASPEGRSVDFGAARGNASFDAEFSGAAKEVDFGKRVGPMEADFSPKARGGDVDLGGARGSALLREGSSDGQVRDMSKMRISAGPVVGNRPSRDGGGLDFGGARNTAVAGRGGSRLSARETGDNPGVNDARAGEANGRLSGGGQEGGGGGGGGRDWGRAREMKSLPQRSPMRGRGGGGDGGIMRGGDGGMSRGGAGGAPVENRGMNRQSSGSASKFGSAHDSAGGDGDAGDWTTVRSAVKPVRGRGGGPQFRNSRTGSMSSNRSVERASFENRAAAPTSDISSVADTSAEVGQ